MVKIGEINTLAVVKQLDFGLYLDGGDDGEILLPNRYIPEIWEIGSYLDVFIYLDSDDKLIATTETPLATIGTVAHLEVTGSSEFGAFMDWGLMKDLMVPFKEQRIPMLEGKSYSVFLYLDRSRRIAASSKLSNHLSENGKNAFKIGQQVILHIASRSDLGYKAVINNTHLGLLHNREAYGDVMIGSSLTGYVQDVRADGRINLMLRRPSASDRSDLAERILEGLTNTGGVSTLTDKSPPEKIHAEFQVSKAHYKRTLGLLYKQKKIKFDGGKIRLIKN